MPDSNTSRVSIHAPVKGATEQGVICPRFGGVSIHAPVKGATGLRRAPRYPHKRFNPRAREGRDKIARAELEDYQEFQSTRP